MIERPTEADAASFYFTYINQVSGNDPLRVLECQLEEALALSRRFVRSGSGAGSIRRYPVMTRALPRAARERIRSRGPITSKSFGACAFPRFRCSGI
jgi:hypothetical protein